MRLNDAVSSALASWLTLEVDDRATLAHAIAALNCLGTGQGSEAAAPRYMPATTIDQPLTIDNISSVDPDIFRSHSYRALGSGQSISIYCAGSRGLFELAQTLGRSHYKIGWTRGARAETRIAHLRATAYGACWQSDRETIRDRGWDNWDVTVLPARERSIGSPVRCLGRSLAVDLPAGVDPSAFDRALMQALASRALAPNGDGDVGQAQCRAQGIDPACLRRLTEQATNRGTRLKVAKEIFAFAPRQEADALARLIEAVIAHAVAPLLQR